LGPGEQLLMLSIGLNVQAKGVSRSKGGGAAAVR
jgi:hypothetical protein